MYTTKRVRSTGTQAFKKGLAKSKERKQKRQKRNSKYSRNKKGAISSKATTKSEAAETEDDELIYIRLELCRVD